MKVMIGNQIYLMGIDLFAELGIDADIMDIDG